MPGVIGVAGAGADQIDFLNAVYGNFPLHAGPHRGAHASSCWPGPSGRSLLPLKAVL